MWLTTWTLLDRGGPDNNLAAAATGKRHTCPLGRDIEKSTKLGLLKHVCGTKANKTSLFTGAGKDSSRVGQTGTVDKTQADAVGGGGYRDDAVRRALVRSKADDREVVVVVGKLGRQ